MSVNVKDSTAMLRVDIGSCLGTMLPRVLIQDLRPFGLPEILNVAHMTRLFLVLSALWVVETLWLVPNRSLSASRLGRREPAFFGRLRYGYRHEPWLGFSLES